MPSYEFIVKTILFEEERRNESWLVAINLVKGNWTHVMEIRGTTTIDQTFFPFHRFVNFHVFES